MDFPAGSRLIHSFVENETVLQIFKKVDEHDNAYRESRILPETCPNPEHSCYALSGFAVLGVPDQWYP